MKRLFSITIFILLLTSVSASNVAYILRNPSRPNTAFITAFEDKGLSVDLISARNLRTTDFSNYQLVFIGDERLYNLNYIPDTTPIIIANGFYTSLFGFTERRSLPRIFSTQQILTQGNNEILIYEDKKSRGLIRDYYYYIPEEGKNPNIQTIAEIKENYRGKKGDVVAYLEDETKKCFFGITKAEKWTSESENLFSDCIDFVSDSQSPIIPDQEGWYCEATEETRDCTRFSNPNSEGLITRCYFYSTDLERETYKQCSTGWQAI